MKIPFQHKTIELKQVLNYEDLEGVSMKYVFFNLIQEVKELRKEVEELKRNSL